ncbi:hypothetical protein M514_13000 [Trichuris suis]|uniref:Uncharacterized protein n=1 Tax=Trichuris suis TaxID=68888 RepID=A0A085LMA9_9BILA|nr:hypothetical protein M513_13000 [Trichuris suis]KFD60127.1 hypothetical protein M514_13000 [Trichuris suis]
MGESTVDGRTSVHDATATVNHYSVSEIMKMAVGTDRSMQLVHNDLCRQTAARSQANCQKVYRKAVLYLNG